ncbi:integrase [Devosia subaequoris]|uniref:Integrase n=1 Tax=Devosia subaequoris TaxID=395930 RepID=A0A7W6NDF1_9HYPH|nr:site-specific integrase [Devosia subaequoris]MBB4053968.1 integrase [Devosia subaequoris]MCP1211578.1 site-specific integrase [Devosia subaequoris]
MSDQDRGHKVDRLAGHRTSVGDVIDGAIEALETGKRRVKGAQSELYRLRAFRRNNVALCSTALSDATEDMFEDWIADRLEVVKPNSVGRDIRLLKPLFAAAARKYDLLRSPLEYVSAPRAIDERIRRISKDEEALLFAELIMAENPIVPLAAEFALETGCRRSEQLRIEWKDYDRRCGTVWLPDAKNGRGRYILLSERAVQVLESLPGRAEGGKIFKVSSNALKIAFEYARARAARRARSMGREDLVSVRTLRWHDFRHEAVSRCFDYGWTSEQVMDFSGHVDIKSLLRYRHPKVDQSVARLRAMKPRDNRVLPVPGVIDAAIGERSGS